MGFKIISGGGVSGGSGGGGGPVAWADITGKPATFTPAPHNQDISTINNLATSLAAKLETITTANMSGDITTKGKALLTKVDDAGIRTEIDLDEEVVGSTEGEVWKWDPIVGMVTEVQLKGISIFWPSPTAITIPLLRKPKFIGNSFEISGKITGTATIALQVDGVAVAGLDAVALGSTPVDAVATNATSQFTGAALVTLVLSGVSAGASNLDITFRYKRIKNDA